MTPDERITMHQEIFASEGGDSVVGRAQIPYVMDALGVPAARQAALDEVDLRELAWGFESLGLESARSDVPEDSLIPVFDYAFKMRSSLFVSGERHDIIDMWMLIASGIASQNQPQLREMLAEIEWQE